MAGLRPTISQFKAIGTHATYYDWGVQFLTLPSGITNFTSDDYNIRAVSSDLPKKTMQLVEIMTRGHRKFQAGICEYGHIFNISLYETIDSKVDTFVHDYFEMLWQDDTGIQEVPDVYKSDILLTRLDSKNNPIAAYTLEGAFLYDFDHSSQLVENSNEVVKFNTIWCYDKYKYKKLV